jgi:hypothetical protein
VFERNLRHYFELPAEVEQECAVADLADFGAGHVGNGGGDLLGVRGVEASQVTSTTMLSA